MSKPTNWLLFAILVGGILFLQPLNGRAAELDPKFKDAQKAALIRGDTNLLSQFSSQTKAEKLTKKWTLMAAQSLNDRGSYFSNQGAASLAEFINQSVATALKNDPSPQKLAEADANFGRLMREMGKIATRDTRGEIGPDTLQKARLSLCPLWPFC